MALSIDTFECVSNKPIFLAQGLLLLIMTSREIDYEGRHIKYVRPSVVVDDDDNRL